MVGRLTASQRGFFYEFSCLTALSGDRGGAVARWRDGAEARWRGCAVARLRGGAVARWRGGTKAKVLCYRSEDR